MVEDKKLFLPKDVMGQLPKENKSTCPKPEVSLPVAKFINWFLKKGGLCCRPEKECKGRANFFGLDLDRDILDYLGSGIIGRYWKPGGGKIIVIKDRTWADQVTEYYDLTLPNEEFIKRGHHGQPSGANKKKKE